MKLINDFVKKKSYYKVKLNLHIIGKGTDKIISFRKEIYDRHIIKDILADVIEGNQIIFYVDVANAQQIKKEIEHKF
ncbi:MAG: hypothetical protein QXS90_02230 [Candidatus Diapherotrites archaeon]